MDRNQDLSKNSKLRLSCKKKKKKRKKKGGPLCHIPLCKLHSLRIYTSLLRRESRFKCKLSSYIATNCFSAIGIYCPTCSVKTEGTPSSSFIQSYCSFDLFNVKLSQGKYWREPRSQKTDKHDSYQGDETVSQEVAEEGDNIYNVTLSPPD